LVKLKPIPNMISANTKGRITWVKIESLIGELFLAKI
jgi:hypothetical protein